MEKGGQAATVSSFTSTDGRVSSQRYTLSYTRFRNASLKFLHVTKVQKVINDLNQQASKSKEEVRRLRKSLSTKEVEATTSKQRLDDLENSLREALGDLSGTRSSLLKVR